jgi:hypothetical protein
MASRCKGFRGWLFGHDEIVTSEGYPAYSRWWVINSTCRRCGQRFRTTDDLFAEERPSWFEIDEDFMSTKRAGERNG